MKIKLNHSQLGGSPAAQWLRRAGYTLIIDHQSGQESFSRRFTRDFYPRFHLYIQEIAGQTNLFFNLHLDQKKASYAGQTRHSADYDGELVEQEANRLQTLLGSNPVNTQAGTKAPAHLPEAPNRTFDRDVLQTLKANLSAQPLPPQRSWWQKLFS